LKKALISIRYIWCALNRKYKFFLQEFGYFGQSARLGKVDHQFPERRNINHFKRLS